MKTKLVLFILSFCILIISSCGFGKVSQSDLVGKTFELGDGFHMVEFVSASSYHIYQKPSNCGGEGSWSLNDGKVILGPNNSNCESTANVAGTYNADLFKK